MPYNNIRMMLKNFFSMLDDELNAVSDSIISHQHNNVQQYQDVQECAHLGSEGGALQFSRKAPVLGRASDHANVPSEQDSFIASTDTQTIQC